MDLHHAEGHLGKLKHPQNQVKDVHQANTVGCCCHRCHRH